ncbi:MAG: putative LPS assembly protein LptD [Candidatus Kapabacteria bacterium]|nr:putative LPS assembly protein LptD [Candidatus Kapabacteria bacterium]
MSYWSKLLWFCRFSAIALALTTAGAQVHIRTEPKKPLSEEPPGVVDTVSAPAIHPPVGQSPPPSLLRTADTLSGLPGEREQLPRGGIDTVVLLAARDTMLFTAADYRLRLRGEARLVLRQQELTAEIIELWLDASELSAEGNLNTNGSEAATGLPRFRDGEQLYQGDRIRYNFRTRRGVVTGVSTQMGEGFYHGGRLKQTEPGTFFVQSGCYTTCNARHPHFRFCTPRMKIIAGDRVFVSPLFVYITDVPVFVFPFGLFFPNRGGRQSGVIAPSFFFSATGGLVLENLGYFLALSDYSDVQFRTTLRTRQGVVLHGLARYAMQRWLEGSIAVSAGWTRPDLDSPFQTQWNLSLQHRQKITPQWDLQANVHLSSPDYFRQVSTDLRQRVLESLLSTLSSSYIFESGMSLSVSLRREQNLLTRAHSGTLPQVTLSLPTWTPLRRLYNLPDWFRQTTINYSTSGLWTYSRLASGAYAHQSFIHHRLSPQISPRLGHFTVVPTLSYEERWYFRQLRQWMREKDSILVQERSAGLFREYSYSAGISVSTRLYGLADLPTITGLQAFRHVFQPTLRITYSPAFPRFYAAYVDYRAGSTVTYSRFALDGGGFAPRKSRLLLDYRLLNSFEVKPLPTDTAPPAAIEFFRLALAGSYNPLADSLHLSDLYFDFSVPALRLFTLQGSAVGTPYAEILTTTGQRSQWQRTNRLRIVDGHFPLRWTSLRFQAQFDFGGHIGTTAQRHDTIPPDWFGEAATPLSAPPLSWQLRLNLSTRYEEPIRGAVTRTASAAIGLGITVGGWQIQAEGNVDLLSRQLVTPAISLTRDLHCWELRLEWYPLGTFRGYWLRFAPKATVLRELKYEEKTIPGL